MEPLVGSTQTPPLSLRPSNPPKPPVPPLVPAAVAPANAELRVLYDAEHVFPPPKPPATLTALQVFEPGNAPL